MKTNRILISLNENYVSDLNEYSKELGLTKSDLIRRALDDYFKKVKDNNVNRTK